MADNKPGSNLKNYYSIIGRNQGPVTLSNNRSNSNTRGQKNKNLSTSGLNPPQISSGSGMYGSSNPIRIGPLYDT